MVTDEVVPEIQGMESNGLRHNADPAAHLFQVQVPQVTSVVVHGAGRGPVESKRQPEEGALASAGLARDRDEFPGAGTNRDVVEDQRAVGVVPVGNAVEENVAAQILDRRSFDFGLGNRSQERAHLVERREHGGDRAKGLAESGDGGLEGDEDEVDDEKIADREGPVHGYGREQQDPGGKQGERGTECPRMSLERAQLEFRAFLLPVVLRPDGEGRRFRVFHTQLAYAAHDLE